MIRWLSVFVFTFLIFFSFGCVQNTYAKTGQCVLISRHIYKVGTGYGYKMRFGVGKIHSSDKVGHQWAEYWNEKRQKWCLWDAAQWTVGKSWYTAEETGYQIFYRNQTGWLEPQSNAKEQ